ncbi:MAG TPA: N-6 DNA methylase [Trueperaceae bacterium]|nr:N-6 DNA methylase [Trueperaceae bacterium]
MANERITENLVRDQLRELDYYDQDDSIRVEEQKSEIAAIKRLLRTASKTGGGGVGSPEFIITSAENPDFVIVIECKADIRRHESPDRDSPSAFAVDGVLHYANWLSQEFNVIALAVSGESTDQMRFSAHLHAKKALSPEALMTKRGAPIPGLIPWADFIEHASFDPAIQRIRLSELMAFSRDLHDFMRDHAKLTESEKPLLVSGTLIALQSPAFAKSYDAYKPEDLPKAWLNTVKEEIDKAALPQAKKMSMTQPYSVISVHPELGRATTRWPRGVLYELIHQLNERVWPFVAVYHDFDVVGQFYGEFLKYTGGDKKALGIVLTPKHITDLFARLANVNKDSTVVDLCAGTGGFLISAMHHMMRDASSEAERDRIKSEGLIGVEQQPNMYALAASNMILRGDGKANLYQGSCFTEAIIRDVRKFKPDVGMLNPPYSQGDKDLHELYFVKQMLDSIEKGGTGIAIVPISCAISPHPAREELMNRHTLEAVMSMPDDLFHPVGTVTCIMVWTARIPHARSKKKTWFGYWKDDCHIKTKHLGRVAQDDWPRVRDHWVESFRNREVHAGQSILEAVGPDDEWCAEAYMETDYSGLDASVFSATMRDYLAARLQRPHSPEHSASLSPDDWKPFRIDSLFTIKKGKRLTKANMTEGDTPFIGAIETNNGVREYIGQKPIHKGNTISVNYNGSVAEAFYQPDPFYASDDVNVLYPRGFTLTPGIGLFLATVIRQEKYRFNYGRKWHMDRMAQSEIFLPATDTGSPDWAFMEQYMAEFPEAKQLGPGQDP